MRRACITTDHLVTFPKSHMDKVIDHVWRSRCTTPMMQLGRCHGLNCVSRTRGAAGGTKRLHRKTRVVQFLLKNHWLASWSYDSACGEYSGMCHRCILVNNTNLLKALRSSETSTPIYWPPWRNIPEDLKFHIVYGLSHGSLNSVGSSCRVGVSRELGTHVERRLLICMQSVCTNNHCVQHFEIMGKSTAGRSGIWQFNKRLHLHLATSGSLPTQHSASSGCGWRNGLQCGG